MQPAKYLLQVLVVTFPFGICFALSLIPDAYLTTDAYADIQRYVDSEGRTHYVDDPSKVPQRYRNQLDGAEALPNITKSKNALFKYKAKGASAAASGAKVELFVTSWCPHCRTLESFLKKQGIRYTKYDIEKSSVGRSKYKALGGGGIPISKIGDTVVRGNNPSGIMNALKQASS